MVEGRACRCIAAAEIASVSAPGEQAWARAMLHCSNFLRCNGFSGDFGVFGKRCYCATPHAD
jgi:hypothetical protein